MRKGEGRVQGLPIIDVVAPDGLYSGGRAITVQSYLEANAKNGVEHELSILFESLGTDEQINSVLVTGSMPVILKRRTASYTGEGVELDIYEDVTYSSLGAEIPQYNLSRINPVTEVARFYSEPVVIDEGVKVFPTEYLIGNQSNQGKGGTGEESGRERILKPNTSYLFRVTSRDSDQDVALFDSWYEGVPDLPVSE